MQRLVDNGLAIAKESVKTFTHESLNNVVRVINGVSALVLTVIPGKAGILDGIHGWELRPTYRGPKLPRWMENGASSFNQLIHDLSAEDASSSSNFGSSDEDDGDESEPSSPVSQASRVSRVSTVSKCDRNQVSWITRVFLWIMWPLAFMICFPFRIYCVIVPKRPRHRKVDSLDNNVPLRVHSRKPNLTKDHVLDHTTDRRRGVIEDLQLAIEIFIENVFSIFHKVAHFILSPITTLQMLNGWLFFGNRGCVNPSGTNSVSVPTSTLGDADPTPTERPATYRNTLNTDSRTCRDIITELGYPYEAINVVTSDGYILLLERIPRHDSQKVVYLQHGILDSSLGWVSNGVVGSPAFAAYDQGYDVFLGNLRGMVSRGHIDKNIPARKYWNYSINEHGTRDMPAIVDKIHELKTSELKIYLPEQDQEGDDQPYKLCAICHSLGGASMLMYLVTRRLEKIPHHISRLILLSPAGFHDESTVLLTLLSFILCPFAPVLAPLIPGFYIPTWFLRMLFNKLARDFHNYPAVGGLVQTIMSYLVGGDSSNWVGLIGQPHYNMNDMPGVSYFVAVHLSQIKRAKKFNMFDYGSKSKNMKAYGSPKPLDVGSLYGLIDVPVDLVAGCRDKVIPASMVRKHYKLMKDAGVEVSYNEFEYAHVDFVFSNSDDFLAYIMSKLLLVVPPPSRQNDQKHLRIKRLTRRRNNGSKKSMDLTTESELLEFRATENEIVAES